VGGIRRCGAGGPRSRSVRVTAQPMTSGFAGSRKHIEEAWVHIETRQLAGRLADLVEGKEPTPQPPFLAEWFAEIGPMSLSEAEEHCVRHDFGGRIPLLKQGRRREARAIDQAAYRRVAVRS
jgi:hypothetical protein